MFGDLRGEPYQHAVFRSGTSRLHMHPKKLPFVRLIVYDTRVIIYKAKQVSIGPPRVSTVEIDHNLSLAEEKQVNTQIAACGYRRPPLRLYVIEVGESFFAGVTGGG